MPVIPAQAGIHSPPQPLVDMDPRVREDDESEIPDVLLSYCPTSSVLCPPFSLLSPLPSLLKMRRHLEHHVPPLIDGEPLEPAHEVGVGLVEQISHAHIHVHLGIAHAADRSRAE